MLMDIVYVPPLRIARGKGLKIRTGGTYTESVPKKKLPPEVLDYFTRMGKKGGALGGQTRAANMSAEQRSESARKAVRARWAKTKRTADDSGD